MTVHSIEPKMSIFEIKLVNSKALLMLSKNKNRINFLAKFLSLFLSLSLSLTLSLCIYIYIYIYISIVPIKNDMIIYIPRVSDICAPIEEKYSIVRLEVVFEMFIIWML